MTDLKNVGSARLRGLEEGNAAVASSSGTRLIQFGLFEADLRTGELRRNGAKIRLQEQPFQILIMLLRATGRSGEPGRAANSFVASRYVR